MIYYGKTLLGSGPKLTAVQDLAVNSSQPIGEIPCQ